MTRERLQEIRQWPHVVSVTPAFIDYGRVFLAGKSEEVQTVSVTVQEKLLRNRLVAGDWFTGDDEPSVVVSEYLLYLWGMASDEEVRGALGCKVRLEYHTGARKPSMLMSLFGLDPTAAGPEQEKVLQKVVQRLPEVMEKLDLTPKEMETLRRTLQGPTLAENATTARPPDFRGIDHRRRFPRAGEGRPPGRLRRRALPAGRRCALARRDGPGTVSSEPFSR